MPVLNVGAAVAALEALMIEMDAEAVLARDELAADRETTGEVTANENEKLEPVAVGRKAVEGERETGSDVAAEAEESDRIDDKDVPTDMLRWLETAGADDMMESEADAAVDSEADATLENELDTMLGADSDAEALLGKERTPDGAVEVSGWVKNDVNDEELAADTEDTSKRACRPCSLWDNFIVARARQAALLQLRLGPVGLDRWLYIAAQDVPSCFVTQVTFTSRRALEVRVSKLMIPRSFGGPVTAHETQSIHSAPTCAVVDEDSFRHPSSGTLRSVR